MSDEEHPQPALHEHPTLYELLVQNTHEFAMFAVDLDGRIASWNPGVENTFGYAKDEFIGQPSALTFTPEDKERGAPENELRTAADEGEAADARWHVRKDGSRLWGSSVMTSLRDPTGELIGFAKVVRDETQRGRIEEMLEESEAKHRSLLDDVLDTSSVGTFILDADFSVAWMNRAIETYFGVDRDSTIGQDKRYLVRTHIQHIFEKSEEFARKVLAAYNSNTYRESFECHVLPGEGREERWLEHWSQPITSGPYAGGRIDHYTDITTRKRAEAQREQLLSVLTTLNENLEQKVTQRTRELTTANTQLRSRNEELESLAYAISHDLRSPLRGVDGFSQAVLEDYRDALDETAVGYLERVRAGAQQMGVLIDNLLSLSRLSRQEMQRERVDLGSIAQAIAQGLQKSAPERQVRFVIAENLGVHGDRELLTVLLKNLLENAWRFTVKQSGARIEFGAKRDAAEVVYFVQDNGVGFDMAYANRLFTAFQRLHPKGEFEGTGVGLAMVRRIVHRHGGRVWAEAGVGKGATFFFTLLERPG